ncbi:TPA: hypothetical protein ACJ6TD_27310 [Klebsiella pneumoniae]|nr:hypothetical protein DMR04_13240 [Klebsiella pneumoniae]HBZ0907380.1 hypothetical protein [Klebsiella pneumoniae]
MDCTCLLVARGRQINDTCRRNSTSRTQLSIRAIRALAFKWIGMKTKTRYDDAKYLLVLNARGRSY